MTPHTRSVNKRQILYTKGVRNQRVEVGLRWWSDHNITTCLQNAVAVSAGSPGRGADLVSCYLSAVVETMYELGVPWRIWHPIIMWNRPSVVVRGLVVRGVVYHHASAGIHE